MRRTDVHAVPHAVQRLVAHVCLTGRVAVAGQLWSDAREQQAQTSRRSALWRLHRMAPGLFDTAGGALAPAPGVRVDVGDLSAWAARTPAPALDDMVLPSAELRGDLLPGWRDNWLLIERERLRPLRLYALETLAGEAVEAARSAVRASCCGRARTACSCGSTWPRATWPPPSAPTGSCARCCAASWGSSRPTG